MVLYDKLGYSDFGMFGKRKVSNPKMDANWIVRYIFETFIHFVEPCAARLASKFAKVQI